MALHKIQLLPPDLLEPPSANDPPPAVRLSTSTAIMHASPIATMRSARWRRRAGKRAMRLLCAGALATCAIDRCNSSMCAKKGGCLRDVTDNTRPNDLVRQIPTIRTCWLSAYRYEYKSA